MVTSRFALLLFAIIFTLPAPAEVYKWLDAEGKTHFANAKPSNGIKTERLEGIENITPPTKAVASGNSPQATAQQVELYVTSWCPFCKKAKAFLNSQHIAFKEYDIERDLDAAARKKSLDPGYSGIPLAVIKGTLVRGFNQSSYEQALMEGH